MDIQHSVLSNGLTVITVNQPDSLMVTTAIFTNTGSRNELEEENGISHALEHHYFKATDNRTTQQIASEIEVLGGYVNAYTGQSMTAYYIKSLAQDIRNSANILADMMINGRFDQSDIDVESGVILQEIAMYLDDPSSVASDGFLATAYPNQALGRTILGNPDFIRNLKKEHFVSYKDRFYFAQNMIVLAAGNVDHQEFCDMVSDEFKNLNSAPGRVLATPSSVYHGGLYKFEKTFEQASVVIGLPSVPALDASAPAENLFNAAVGVGMSSPLFQEVRERRGLVYSVRSHCFSDDLYGMFTVSGGMTKENVEEFFKVVMDVLKEASHTISETDFTRAMNTVKVGYGEMSENAFKVGQFVAKNFFMRGRIYTPQEAVSSYANLTVDDLYAAASRIFSGNPTISVVGPAPDLDYHGDVVAALA